MKARLFMSVAAVAILVTASVAAPKLNLKGVKCVMNAKAAAKAKSSADFKGGKVYFCCGNWCESLCNQAKRSQSSDFW